FGLAMLLYHPMLEPCDQHTPPVKPSLDIGEFKARLFEKLDPRITIPARISILIEMPGWKADDLDLVLAAPDFPTPMYKSLDALGQEWLLTGIERVPTNTLAITVSNNSFIEAFMVGLNHEMGRELLWRRYPTELRATYFRQFWDPSGRFLELSDPQDP